jgi:transposase-like protein
VAKPWTQVRAASIVAKPRVGQLGVYLQVRNNASENGLSLLTRGRLKDAMTPSFSKGLRAAARRVFNATHQRCRFHWMKNALAHTPAKQRTALAAMLKTIFARETKTNAETQWGVVADALREKQDKLGAFMDDSRDDVLAYMDFPLGHWTQIASTNPLERVNREIRAAPTSSGHSPTMTPSSVSSARSCWRPTTNGPWRDATCRLKPSPASPTIPPSGCPPWRPDQT